jgi:hypothetical protein
LEVFFRIMNLRVCGNGEIRLNLQEASMMRRKMAGG